LGRATKGEYGPVKHGMPKVGRPTTQNPRTNYKNAHGAQGHVGGERDRNQVKQGFGGNHRDKKKVVGRIKLLVVTVKGLETVLVSGGKGRRARLHIKLNGRGALGHADVT